MSLRMYCPRYTLHFHPPVIPKSLQQTAEDSLGFIDNILVMVIHIVSSNIGMTSYMVYNYSKFGLVHTMVFLFDFVFKNRLIRLGFPKTKLTTYWFQVRSQNHYTTELTVTGRHIKVFSDDSSGIHLILLIQLSYYKREKDMIGCNRYSGEEITSLSSIDTNGNDKSPKFTYYRLL